MLSAADLSLVDARHTTFNGAVLSGVRFEGAKLFGATFEGARVTTRRLEWIDVSAAADGSQRLDPGARQFVRCWLLESAKVHPREAALAIAARAVKRGSRPTRVWSHSVR